MNDVLADAVVTLVVLPLLTALGGWLATKMPGPLRDWLASGTHQRDIELLLGAMARRAAASLAERPGLQPTVTDVVAYAKATLPGTVAKLAPTEGALETMAMAALRSAIQPPAAAPPLTGQVVPRAVR